MALGGVFAEASEETVKTAPVIRAAENRRQIILLPCGHTSKNCCLHVSFVLGFYCFPGSFHFIGSATLPAAEAASSIALQLVDCNQFAVPVKVEVCVPAKSATERVAVFAPVVCAVCGVNCTVTTQVAAGAKVVIP